MITAMLMFVYFFLRLKLLTDAMVMFHNLSFICTSVTSSVSLCVLVTREKLPLLRTASSLVITSLLILHTSTGFRLLANIG